MRSVHSKCIKFEEKIECSVVLQKRRYYVYLLLFINLFWAIYQNLHYFFIFWHTVHCTAVVFGNRVAVEHVQLPLLLDVIIE